jgi:hypothetical protein
MFVEATDTVFGATGDLARVIKVRDVDGDGDPDILVGTTYQTQSRLFRNDGGGAFTEVTATHLPQMVLRASCSGEFPVALVAVCFRIAAPASAHAGPPFSARGTRSRSPGAHVRARD